MFTGSVIILALVLGIGMLVLVGMVVFVAVALSRSVAEASRRTAQQGAGPARLSEATALEISGLLREGKRIHAVKVLREATALSLLDAKNRVDRWSEAAELSAAREPETPASLIGEERLRVEAAAVLAAAGWHTAETFLREQRGLTPDAAKSLLDSLG